MRRAALGLFLLLCGCGAPRLQVEGAWARTILENGSVYFTVGNSGNAADTLLGARCEEAVLAEVHRSFIEDGIMGMEPAGELKVAAGKTLEFKPLGLHVMLAGLKRRHKAGDQLHLKLMFKKSGTVDVTAEVKPL